MIGFLVGSRVRIKIRIRVRVRVGLSLMIAFIIGAIVAGTNVHSNLKVGALVPPCIMDIRIKRVKRLVGHAKHTIMLFCECLTLASQLFCMTAEFALPLKRPWLDMYPAGFWL